MFTTFSISTPYSIAFRYSRITRSWWTRHGGQQAAQELLLAVVLSMTANYFYYVELALGLTTKFARGIVTYTPLVAGVTVAAAYQAYITVEAVLDHHVSKFEQVEPIALLPAATAGGSAPEFEGTTDSLDTFETFAVAVLGVNSAAQVNANNIGYLAGSIIL